MAMIPRVDARAPVTEIGGQLAEHGAVIVERLFPQSVVDAVNAEVDAAVAAAETGMATHHEFLTAFHGPNVRHVTGVVAKSPAFATDVMSHAVYRAMCDQFLRPSCSRWQLNLAHLIVRGPGAIDQMLHRDADIWMEVPYPRPGELQLASLIAFVDFTRENGATRVIPGSHRWPDVQTHVTERTRRPSEADAVYAEMPAGSAVIYLGSTYHGASANTTADVWRRGAHLSFTLGWLRTEENNYLAVPPDVARTLPRDCQEILGYPVCGFLGTLDMLDPLELMADGRL